MKEGRKGETERPCILSYIDTQIEYFTLRKQIIQNLHFREADSYLLKVKISFTSFIYKYKIIVQGITGKPLKIYGHSQVALQTKG